MFRNPQPILAYPTNPEEFIARIVTDATTRPNRETLTALQNGALSLNTYLTVAQWITVVEQINTVWAPRNLGLNLVANYIEQILIPSFENESEMDLDERHTLR